jgi:ADP-ribosylglycohydrolase
MKSGLSLRDRFVGCLLGGAVGDALGAPVEFATRADILVQFGPHGIRDYVRAYGRVGAITDDTQMTLFTAEGLVRAAAGIDTDYDTAPDADSNADAADAATPGPETRAVALAYQRWLRTQGGSPFAAAVASEEAVTHLGRGLVALPEMHALRAPGGTCLSALQSARHAAQRADNDSKGCGGVIRVAPAGLYAMRWSDYAQSIARAFDLGADFARITHGHPTGYLSAGVFAVLVLRLLHGDSVAEALDVACERLRGHVGHEETLAILRTARTLARSGRVPHDSVRALGEGWVGEEALAIAVYAALVARDFEEGLAIAVNHSGDSDSTGAIAGNLLGALHGVDAIPSRWLEPLELRDTIVGLAEALLPAGERRLTR